MILWGIFISAFLIGFSGAMMPGPMLGVTIEGSLKKGWTAGPLIVVGHGILEIILVLILAFGLGDFFSNPIVAGFIGLFGGAFLAWMGYGMLKAGISGNLSLNNQEFGNIKKGRKTRNPIITGFLVSGANPYFVIWWASTGVESIRRSYAFGILGILFFFVGHILADFTWYTVVSTALSRGKKLISDTVYSRIILLLGIFIIGFSIYFISSGYKMLVKI